MTDTGGLSFATTKYKTSYAKGAIMDLCMEKIRVFHPCDRSSVTSVRETVDNFYRGEVRIADSWIMKLK